MDDLKKQLILLIGLIEDITKFFYQQKNQEAYVGLLEVIDKLTITIVNLEDASIIKTNNMENSKLTITLKDVMHALEDKDTVLIADILQYELIEQLKEICNLL